LVGADGAKVGDARKDAPLREAAAEMLVELLANGPQPMVEVSEIVQKNVPCKQKSVLSAANRLRLIKRPVRANGKVSHWTWEMPLLKINLE
jgi:hypothetical protein